MGFHTLRRMNTRTKIYNVQLLLESHPLKKTILPNLKNGEMLDEKVSDYNSR